MVHGCVRCPIRRRPATATRSVAVAIGATLCAEDASTFLACCAAFPSCGLAAAALRAPLGVRLADALLFLLLAPAAAWRPELVG